MKVFLISNKGFRGAHPFYMATEWKCETWAKVGVEVVDDPFEADVIVCDRFPGKSFVEKHKDKPFFLWTHEPRYNTSFVGVHGFAGATFHVCNAYTGDVFTTPLAQHGYYVRTMLPLCTPDTIRGRGRVVMVATAKEPGWGARQGPIIRNGKDIDLLAWRRRVALAWHKAGDLDIYGRNWPAGVAKERPFPADCFRDKVDNILPPYLFNFCPENTDIPNYVTEKIFGALAGGCLPVYHGSAETIYKIFPRDSFVDCRDFPDPADLFLFVRGMGEQEYIQRMNRCIVAQNKIRKSDRGQAAKVAAFHLAVNKLMGIGK